MPDSFERSQIAGQLKAELITALQPAFAKISCMGIRYSMLPAHSVEISDALREESERAAREDARLREERLPAAKREFAASVKRFIGAGASLLLCLAIAVVLWCSITAVAGSGILIGAIACTVLAAVFLVFTALATKRFVLARTALSACTVPGKTEEGRHAAALAEEEALLRSVAEDLRK